MRNRSGDPYKPSALRGYEQALRTHLLPSIGGARLDDVRRPDLQALADRLVRDGLSPSTVRNALMPMRAICRERTRAAKSRTTRLVDSSFQLFADVEIASRSRERQRRCWQHSSRKDRPLWATAFYAGLRRGELQALRWSDLDTARGVIQVRRSWDRVAGETRTQVGGRPPSGSDSTSSRGPSGCRRPTQSQMRSSSDAPPTVRSSQGPSPTGPVGRGTQRDFAPITLHECRHTYASFMIAAGVNREGAADVHGTRVDHHHARSLREALPGLRRRGSRPPQRLS